MSVLGAIDRLGKMAKERPESSLNGLVAVLRQGAAGDSALDFEYAIHILQYLPALKIPQNESRIERLRTLISQLIVHTGPNWRHLLPLGRSYLETFLHADVQQAFYSADLYSSPPTESVINWWDDLAGKLRAIDDQGLLETGRLGEELTMRREREVLDALGLSHLPVLHVGFEDNTLGYDVKSFSVTTGKPIPKFIEVKATSGSTMQFYLSRSEWETATRCANQYVLHLWHLPSRRLIEATFDELLPHIPLDQARGRWDTAIVKWE